MTSSTRFLAAGALVTIATIAMVTPGARAAGDDDKDLKVSMTLAEVRAFPEAYKRVPFELALLYHGPRDVYNPFYTLFEPSSYMNFAAWPADAPVFTRDGFCNDYPLFYVERKNEPLQKVVVAMRPMTWFTANCIVRSTAQGRAWIEVLNVSSAGPAMESSDLRHLVRANVLANTGEFERSLLEFEMARLFGVPKRFIARCRSEEGRVALAANQPERAVAALEQAWQWFPEDRQVAALLDRATTQIAVARQQQVASVPASQPLPLHRTGTSPAYPPLNPPSVDPQAPAPAPQKKKPAVAKKPVAAPVKPEVKPEPEPVPEPEPPVTEPQDDGEPEPETTPADDPDAEPVTAPDEGETTEDETTEEPEVTPEEEPAVDPDAAPEVTDEPSNDPNAEPVEPTDPDAEPMPVDPDEEPVVEPDGEPIDPDAEPVDPDDGGEPDDGAPAPEEPTTPPDDGSDGR